MSSLYPLYSQIVRLRDFFIYRWAICTKETGKDQQCAIGVCLLKNQNADYGAQHDTRERASGNLLDRVLSQLHA